MSQVDSRSSAPNDLASLAGSGPPRRKSGMRAAHLYIGSFDPVLRSLIQRIHLTDVASYRVVLAHIRDKHSIRSLDLGKI
jgi:hypothetical protein